MIGTGGGATPLADDGCDNGNDGGVAWFIGGADEDDADNGGSVLPADAVARPD